MRMRNGTDGPDGSWRSLWSKNSALSIGSVDSFLSVGSVGSALSAVSTGSVLAWRSRGNAALTVAVAAAAVAGAALLYTRGPARDRLSR